VLLCITTRIKYILFEINTEASGVSEALGDVEATLVCEILNFESTFDKYHIFCSMTPYQLLNSNQ
jgi:uncharacterized protein (UPF0216 family)